MATLMLEGGADVRYIQEMLGHARLETTEVHTHVAIRQLKAVHTVTHAGATLSRHRNASLPPPAPDACPQEPPGGLERDGPDR